MLYFVLLLYVLHVPNMGPLLLYGRKSCKQVEVEQVESEREF